MTSAVSHSCLAMNGHTMRQMQVAYVCAANR